MLLLSHLLLLLLYVQFKCISSTVVLDYHVDNGDDNLITLECLDDGVPRSDALFELFEPQSGTFQKSLRPNSSDHLTIQVTPQSEAIICCKIDGASSQNASIAAVPISFENEAPIPKHVFRNTEVQLTCPFVLGRLHTTLYPYFISWVEGAEFPTPVDPSRLSPDNTTLTVTIREPTTFQCVLNLMRCSSQCSVLSYHGPLNQIHVFEPSQIIGSPVKHNVCGDVAHVSCTGNGSYVTVTWTFNNSLICNNNSCDPAFLEYSENLITLESSIENRLIRSTLFINTSQLNFSDISNVSIICTVEQMIPSVFNLQRSNTRFFTTLRVVPDSASKITPFVQACESAESVTLVCVVDEACLSVVWTKNGIDHFQDQQNFTNGVAKIRIESLSTEGEATYTCRVSNRIDVVAEQEFHVKTFGSSRIAATTNTSEEYYFENFGECSPYSELSPLCNGYISNGSYVYVLNGFTQFDVSGILNQLEPIFSGEGKCGELISRMVCNYFFAPCGSQSSGANLPLSVCQEGCEYVRDSCPSLWLQVNRKLHQQTSEIIFCNDTTRRFQDLPTCCSNFGITNQGSLVNPDIFSYFTSDVLEVNGSSSTGNCFNVQQIGTIARCEAAVSSDLFDGFVPPTLNFSSLTWARDLFVLNSTTELIVEWHDEVVLSRIEVVMFNCPEWGIAVQSIGLLAPKGHDIVASIDVTDSTSCNSFITVCLPVPKSPHSFALLEFSLLPSSQWMSIAEVRFHTNSDCSQALPITTVEVIKKHSITLIAATISSFSLVFVLILLGIFVFIFIIVAKKKGKHSTEENIYEVMSDDYHGYTDGTQANYSKQPQMKWNKKLEPGQPLGFKQVILRCDTERQYLEQFEDRVVKIFDISHQKNPSKDVTLGLVVPTLNMAEFINNEVDAAMCMPEAGNCSETCNNFSQVFPVNPAIDNDKAHLRANVSNDSNADIAMSSGDDLYERVPDSDISQYLNGFYERVPSVNVAKLLEENAYERAPNIDIAQLREMLFVYEKVPSFNIAQSLEQPRYESESSVDVVESLKGTSYNTEDEAYECVPDVDFSPTFQSATGRSNGILTGRENEMDYCV